MSTAATLAANLRRARLAHGWTQEFAAEKAELTIRHFQDIEAGRRAGLRLTTIDKLAKAFRVQPWELLQPGRFPAGERARGKRAPRIKR